MKQDANAELFLRRQKDFLKLANTRAGRYLLKCGVDAPIVGLTHNAIVYDWGRDFKGRKQLKGEFFVGYNRNTYILAPILEKLDIAREARKYSLAQKDFLTHADVPWIFLDGPTEFQAASGGTGGIYATDAVYTTARSATSASADQQAISNDGVGGVFEITRWFCPTDFSIISAGSDVTAASGAIWPVTRNTTIDDTLQFILTTQASTSAISNDDFDNLTLNSPTVYGTSGAYSTLNLNAYNTVTMTAGFQTLVESGAGGFIKMGARASGDVSNTSPTTNRSLLTMSQTNGERTKFTITWTPGGSYMGRQW